MRYFIYFSYKGTAYCGWQIQPNGNSIQAVMEHTLSTMLRTEIRLTAAGRTDAGVHALQMTAHFDIDRPQPFDSDFVGKLNRFLPKDIAVEKIVEVAADTHARFDAISRRYEYHLTTEKDVFLDEYAMRAFHPLDFDAMNRAAQLLLEYTDFTSFSKLHTDVKTNNCKITSAQWRQERPNLWVFTIEADRFLRNMVRAIVGTLLDVGRGKMSLDEFRQVIEAKNRCRASASVPPQGLYLVHVRYPF